VNSVYFELLNIFPFRESQLHSPCHRCNSFHALLKAFSDVTSVFVMPRVAFISRRRPEGCMATLRTVSFIHFSMVSHVQVHYAYFGLTDLEISLSKQLCLMA